MKRDFRGNFTARRRSMAGLVIFHYLFTEQLQKKDVRPNGAFYQFLTVGHACESLECSDRIEPPEQNEYEDQHSQP